MSETITMNDKIDTFYIQFDFLGGFGRVVGKVHRRSSFKWHNRHDSNMSMEEKLFDTFLDGRKEVEAKLSKSQK